MENSPNALILGYMNEPVRGHVLHIHALNPLDIHGFLRGFGRKLDALNSRDKGLVLIADRHLGHENTKIQLLRKAIGLAEFKIVGVMGDWGSEWAGMLNVPFVEGKPRGTMDMAVVGIRQEQLAQIRDNKNLEAAKEVAQHCLNRVSEAEAKISDISRHYDHDALRRAQVQQENAERLAREAQEAVRLAREAQEAVRLEAERLEAERLEAARLEAERLEAARLEAERLEAARLEAERLEAARLEAERLEAARLEAERLEAERLEAARLEAERLEAARLEAERLEAERLEAARREAARLEAERLEAARLEAERLEAARLEAARLEAERLEAARLEAERREAKRLEAARLEAERLEAERLEAEAVALARTEANERSIKAYNNGAARSDTMDASLVIEESEATSARPVNIEHPKIPVAAQEQVRVVVVETIKPERVKGRIRSGQLITHAGDVIIEGSVHSGGEVVSSGDIHVYGKGGGRLLAGVAGDMSACIYVQDFDAEMISIAGKYSVFEDLEAYRHWRGRSLKISLKDGALRFEAMDMPKQVAA